MGKITKFYDKNNVEILAKKCDVCGFYTSNEIRCLENHMANRYRSSTKNKVRDRIRGIISKSQTLRIK